MADGEWISGSKGDFEEDATLEIVNEDGRPSYFRAKACVPNSDRNLANDHTAGLVSDVEPAIETSEQVAEEKVYRQSSPSVSSCLDESEEEKITELVRAMSYNGAKTTEGDFINSFLESGHPLLNPHSGKFSSKAWLQMLMSITSRDPERYSKGVVGIAFKSLSAHGFGQPTDYQKTFGNYPLKFLSLARKFFGMGRKTRIQILRDLDGLVKNGEMLVVLGRPGR